MRKIYEESKNQVIEVALSLKKHDDQKMYQEFVKKYEITDDDFEWFFSERIIRNAALAMLMGLFCIESIMFTPDSKLDILCIILALIFTLKALYFKFMKKRI